MYMAVLYCGCLAISSSHLLSKVIISVGTVLSEEVGFVNSGATNTCVETKHVAINHTVCGLVTITYNNGPDI